MMPMMMQATMLVQVMMQAMSDGGVCDDGSVNTR
jgi:hypothetical protein